MVINTNIEAQRTADHLQASQTRLQKTLSRLSSGSRIVNAADDAAGLAISSRLESSLRRIGSVMNNIGNAMSLTQTQDGFLKNIDHAMQRMTELAMLAQDNTKQAQDRALYNKEFQQLMDYVLSTRGKEFNGVSLFDGSKMDVTIDPDGNTFPVGGIDLHSSVYESALKKQSWQLTSNAWATSKSGYLVNQASYKLSTAAYKLTSDLWYNAGAWSATDNGGTKYDAGTFVRNDGAIITTNPPGANSTAFSSGDYTTTNLGDPNYGNGMFTDGAQFSTLASGTFLASDPTADGDLDYQHRTTVGTGHIISVDPSTEDSSATPYSSGATIISEQDLSGAPYNATNLGGVEIATIDGAKAALTVIFKALDQVALDRASLGAIQQRIEFTSSQLTESKQNLTKAKSRITDVDMAMETTEYAKQQILVQAGTQMLRQANSLPQTALELLR